jgi:hypothetical protein
MLDGDVLRAGSVHPLGEEDDPKHVAAKAKGLGMEAFVHIMGGLVPGIYLNDVQQGPGLGNHPYMSNPGGRFSPFSTRRRSWNPLYSVRRWRGTWVSSLRCSRDRARSRLSYRADRRPAKRLRALSTGSPSPPAAPGSARKGARC